MILIKATVKLKKSSDQILGFRDEFLYVAISTSPTKGQANRALTKLLCEWANLRTDQIKIIKSLTSRIKVVKMIGIPQSQIDNLQRTHVY